MISKKLEDAAIAIEARNRDPAELVEATPFLGVLLEMRAILVQPLESELADAPLQALADLPAYLTEAGPPEAHARKRPLKE
jgi:hypothetical protein